MNIITANLTDPQQSLIKDISRDQIKSLINVSADHRLLADYPPETRKEVLSQLIRDFSKLSDMPNQLFNVHYNSKAILIHQLTQITWGSSDVILSYNGYPLSEIQNLWKKIIIVQDFSKVQLQ